MVEDGGKKDESEGLVVESNYLEIQTKDRNQPSCSVGDDEHLVSK